MPLLGQDTSPAGGEPKFRCKITQKSANAQIFLFLFVACKMFLIFIITPKALIVKIRPFIQTFSVLLLTSRGRGAEKRDRNEHFLTNNSIYKLTFLKRMKKIFTLIAVAAMAVSANAQSWTVAEDTNVEKEQTYVSDALVTVTSTFAGTLKKAAATIAEKEFTHYIQVRVDAQPTVEAPEGTDKGGSTSLIFAPKSDIDVVFYYRRQAANNDFVSNDGKDLKVSDHADASVLDGTLTVSSKTDDEAYGFVTKAYTLKANQKYTVWGRGTTLNFYGFDYAISTGISNVKAAATDAAIYNMAGQKVGKDYKGVVIQNGKKFVVK